MIRFMICVVALACGTAFAVAAEAAPDAPGKPDVAQLFEQFVDQQRAEVTSAEANASRRGPPSDTRLRSLEARVAQLERTSIDAAEAERIADMVVDRRIKELRLAINTADGGQRVETVRLDDGSTMEVTLGPGETLSSVTDPVTGRVHSVGEATSRSPGGGSSDSAVGWQTPYGEFRMQRRSVDRPRRLRWRGVASGNCTTGACGL